MTTAEHGESAPRARAKRERVRPALVALRATPDGAELSQEAVARAVGCSEKLAWELEQDPGFWRDVHDAVLVTERAHLGAVYRSLRAQALKGDVNAIKVYLSQAGVLKAEKVELGGTVGVNVTAEYRELRAVVLAAVELHPDARARLLAALEAGEHE